MKILIVDYDPVTLNVLSASLTSLGHQVITAKNGREALDILTSSVNRDEQVKLLLTDLEIPYMSGLELIRSVRKMIPGLPAILMTAFSDRRVRDEVRRLDCCVYME
ncbi:MAG: response regulator, partial [Desulfatiglandales bacterium]